MRRGRRSGLDVDPAMKRLPLVAVAVGPWGLELEAIGLTRPDDAVAGTNSHVRLMSTVIVPAGQPEKGVCVAPLPADPESADASPPLNVPTAVSVAIRTTQPAFTTPPKLWLALL